MGVTEEGELGVEVLVLGCESGGGGESLTRFKGGSGGTSRAGDLSIRGAAMISVGAWFIAMSRECRTFCEVQD